MSSVEIGARNVIVAASGALTVILPRLACEDWASAALQRSIAIRPAAQVPRKESQQAEAKLKTVSPTAAAPGLQESYIFQKSVSALMGSNEQDKAKG